MVSHLSPSPSRTPPALKSLVTYPILVSKSGLHEDSKVIDTLFERAEGGGEIDVGPFGEGRSDSRDPGSFVVQVLYFLLILSPIHHCNKYQERYTERIAMSNS